MSSPDRVRKILMGGLGVGLLVLLAILVFGVGSEGATIEPVASAASVLQAESACAGDSNWDGVRDIRDIVLIQAHILNRNALDTQALTNADVNQDSKVDVRDIVALLSHNLGKTVLTDCETVFPSEPPSIRFIAPSSGPAGTAFTLIGRGFSAVASQNTLLFFRPDQTLQALITGASEDRIFGIVPQGVEPELYAVAVTVNRTESNGVDFEANPVQPAIEVKPSSSTILMPPGSGKETFVIGGGTPPYKLKPLIDQDLEFIQPNLNGTVLGVTGLKSYRRVTLEIEDSADPPANTRAFVEVMDPRFEPTLTVIPHTLLAGTTPGYTLILSHGSDDLRPSKTEIQFDNIETDFSVLAPGSTIGIGTQFIFGSLREDFQGLIVSEVGSADQILFDVFSSQDDAPIPAARGTLGAGSAVLTLEAATEPVAESLMPGSSTQEVILGDRYLRLPQAGNETFEVTAKFTSVTAHAGQDLPLTKVQTQTFQTVGLTPGAPRTERLLPVLGPVGQLVEITGSGFDPDPAVNTVTFQGEFTLFQDPESSRVEATVESASPDELKVRVPQEAISGPVRVTVNGVTGNDYQFFVLFRPDAGIFFPEFKAGQPVGPLLVLRQLSSPRVARLLDQNVPFDFLAVVLDQGNIKTDTLEIGQAAGTARLNNNDGSGTPTDYLLVYGGLEEEGERNVFHLKRTLEEDSSDGTLYLWESDGVRLEFRLTDLASFVSLLSKTLSILFEEAVYVPPEAPGTTVNTSAEVRSVEWNFFPEPMVVVFPAELEIE